MKMEKMAELEKRDEMKSNPARGFILTTFFRKERR